MLVALVTNIRYVRTQCALHRAMCTHVAVHCARPGVHCVLSVQKCERPVESHPPARITPPGGNKCRICWVLVSNVMDYEFIVAVNLYYFSVTLSSFIAFVFHIFFFVSVFVFSHPSSAWGVWSILSSPSSNYKKFNYDFKPSFNCSRSCTRFAIHFHFFNKVNWHLKWTVFFLSKRQEFNLWKIGSPIIFLYRPAPFACSWCFSSVNKVKISNLL